METSGLKVKVTPDVLVPKRWAGLACRFGVGEIIYLSFDDPTANQQDIKRGRWATSPPGVGYLDNSALYPGEARYICPAGASQVRLQFTVPAQANAAIPGPRVIAEVRFSVIAPTFNFVKIDEFHFQSEDPNAGFHAVGVLTPDDVSFARVALKEVGGANRWTATVNVNPAIAGQLNLLGTPHGVGMEHWAGTGFNQHPRAGAYANSRPVAIVTDGKNTIRSVGPVTGTAFGADRVYNPLIAPAPKPWVALGTPAGQTTWLEASLTIPLIYQVIPKAGGLPPEHDHGTLLAENVHKIKVTKDGTLEVSKGGNSVTYHRLANSVGNADNPAAF